MRPADCTVPAAVNLAWTPFPPWPCMSLYLCHIGASMEPSLRDTSRPKGLDLGRRPYLLPGEYRNTLDPALIARHPSTLLMDRSAADRPLWV